MTVEEYPESESATSAPSRRILKGSSFGGSPLITQCRPSNNLCDIISAAPVQVTEALLLPYSKVAALGSVIGPASTTK